MSLFCFTNSSLLAISFYSLAESVYTICVNQFGSGKEVSFVNPFFGFSEISNSLVQKNFSVSLGLIDSISIIFQSSNVCPANYSAVEYFCNENKYIYDYEKENNEFFLWRLFISNFFISKFLITMSILFLILLFLHKKFRRKSIYESDNGQTTFSFELNSHSKSLITKSLLNINSEGKMIKYVKSGLSNGTYFVDRELLFRSGQILFSLNFRESVPEKLNIDYEIKLPAVLITDDREDPIGIDVLLHNSKNHESSFKIEAADYSLTYRPKQNIDKLPIGYHYLNNSYTETIIMIVAGLAYNVTSIETLKDFLKTTCKLCEFDGIGFFLFQNDTFTPIDTTAKNQEINDILFTYAKTLKPTTMLNLKVHAKTIHCYRIAGSAIYYKLYQFALVTARKSDTLLIRSCERIFIQIFAHILPLIYDIIDTHDMTPGTHALIGLLEDQDYIGFLSFKDNTLQNLNQSEEESKVCFYPYIPDSFNQFMKTVEDTSVFDVESSENCISSRSNSSSRSSNFVKLKSKKKIYIKKKEFISTTAKKMVCICLVGSLKKGEMDDEIDFLNITNPLLFDSKGMFYKNNFGFHSINELQNQIQIPNQNISIVQYKSRVFYLINFGALGGILVEFVPSIEIIDPICLKDNHSFAVWVINLQDMSVIWSILNEKSLYTSELTGIQFIYSICHPNDLKNLSEGIEHLKSVTSMSLSVEIRLKLYSSDYEWYQVHLIKRSSTYVIIFALSVNEYKEQIKLFREVDEQLNAGMVYSDVICWSFEDTHTPTRIYNGSLSQTQTIEFNWTTVKYNVVIEAQDMFTNILKQAITNNSNFTVECPVFFDQFRYLFIRGVSTGKPGHLIGISVDITALRHASDEALLAKKSAEEALNAKSHFLLSMSHEIRTPLYGILSLMKLLVSTNLTEEQKQMLSIVRRSFDRLMELLNDTLDLAKIEQGKMDKNQSKFDPIKLLSEILMPFVQQNKDKLIFCHYMPSLPILYLGEPHFMSRILYNLISNAIKFTEPGGKITITVSHSEPNYIKASDGQKLSFTRKRQCPSSTREKSSDLFSFSDEYESEYEYESSEDTEDTIFHGYLNIKVQDTGIGIHPEDQHRIFDAFIQGDSSVTRPYGGLGVGLALVKKMLDLLGGRLKMESKVGVGSKFKVSLPFEPLYIPYIPSTIKEIHFQILILVSEPFSQFILPIANFYGFDVISDPSNINYEKLILVILDNYERDNQLCLSIKKEQPKALLLYIKTDIDHQIDNFDSDNFLMESIPLPLGYFSDFFKSIIYSNIHSSNDLNDKQVLISRTSISTTGSSSQLNFDLGKIQNLKVLVVDDNKTNQLVFSKILDKIGCKYYLVENGIEAIEKLKQDEYDIAFFDREMPLMDGPTTTKQIRNSGESYSNIPIVAMTASNMKEDEKECLESGMNFFLSKPITISKVLECLNTIFEYM